MGGWLGGYKKTLSGGSLTCRLRGPLSPSPVNIKIMVEPTNPLLFTNHSTSPPSSDPRVLGCTAVFTVLLPKPGIE